MQKPIRVLIIEDVEDDAILLARELRRGGYEVAFERVDTAASMRNALERKPWDVILCDFTMPYFDGAAALQLAKESGTDAPFIYVSGTIGEDTAIGAMKSGAQDYVMKTNLGRLAPAVERELQEARVRRESRVADAAMRESEHKYRHLFDALSDAVFLIDEASGRIIDTNVRAENLLGGTRTEIIGSNQARLFAPRNDQPGFDSVRAAASGGHPGGCELDVFRYDGRAVPVHASASRIKLHGRTLLLTVLRDVTERNRMDEQLRQLSRAVEQSPVSIVITDPAGNITYVNRKFTAVTGYTISEVVGKNPRILKSGETTPGVYEQLWKTITSGKEWRGEIRNKKKTGELYWEFASISPIMDESGKITRFLAVKEDITARKELEEQFRQSQKMEAIGHLAGGVAHDFNNVLAVIRGNTEIALMALKTPNAEIGEYLKQVISAAERAAHLTRQLLAFSRKQAMQPQPLNLNDAIGNLTKMLNRIIGEQVRLQCNYGPGLPFIHADVGMIEQVLVNLAVNARDAMPQGGQLLISTEKVHCDELYVRTHPEARAGEFVCFSVKDTGTGIAPEHLPRIFEPFFTTKEVGKGTGLGLATVYGIVKQHQGWIEVSTRPGAGATFRILLPAISVAAKPTTASTAASLTPGGTERILLVEDDAGVRLLTRRLLETVGYQVSEAASGRDALEIWRNLATPVDLLLTDLVLPDGVTGSELAEQLRAQTPQLKVIFMSGYSAEMARKDAEFIRRTKVSFLQKPVPADVLLQTIRECLDEKCDSSQKRGSQKQDCVARS